MIHKSKGFLNIVLVTVVLALTSVAVLAQSNTPTPVPTLSFQQALQASATAAVQGQPRPTATVALAEPASAEVTLLTLGESVDGEFSEDVGEALYELVATAGDEFTIALSSNNLDTYLLVKAGDNVIAQDDDSGEGTSSTITSFRAPATGTFTIVATTYAAYTDSPSLPSGEFSLLVTAYEAPVVEAAGEIAFDEPLSGRLTNDNGSVQYTFTGEADQQVTITQDSSDFDTYLQLLNADNEVLFEDDDGGELGTNSAIINFELPYSGEYTINASSYSMIRNNSPLVGNFTVTLTAGQALGQVEGEIQLGEAINGTLSLTAPELRYTFAAEAGVEASISLSAESFDTYLIVLDPNGDEVLRDDDGGNGTNSLISNYRFDENGDYTIVATSYSYGSGGTTGVFGDFTLLVDSFESEFIELGETVNASLDLGIANYSFEAAAGTEVTIVLDTDSFDSTLTLYQDSLQLQYSDDNGIDTDSLIGPIVLEEGGEYTLQLTSYSQDTSAEYSLSLLEVVREPFSINEPKSLAFDGAPAAYAFDVSLNDLRTVDIGVTGEGVKFFLRDEYGSSYSAGASENPAPQVRNFFIADDRANYQLLVIGGADSGDATLTVAPGELLSLEVNTPMTLKFDGITTEQYLELNAPVGESLTITIQPTEPVETWYFSADIIQESSGYYAAFSGTNGESVSHTFTVPSRRSDAPYLRVYSYSEAEYTVTLTSAE
ncbi:MAG: PPC domain-containing protein [Phototrophicaceae bacterium]